MPRTPGHIFFGPRAQEGRYWHMFWESSPLVITPNAQIGYPGNLDSSPSRSTSSTKKQTCSKKKHFNIHESTVSTHTHTPTRENQRTAYEILFLPSAVWVLEIKLRSSWLAASAFTRRASYCWLNSRVQNP